MAAAVPAQFVYTYESKTQAEKPANNATYMSSVTRNDPNFLWQNSGQRARSGTVWVRATKRRITPEFKAYLAAEKAKREAEFDFLSGILGQMKMNNTNNTMKIENSYAASLTTGMTANQRREVQAQAARLKADINTITSLLKTTGMEGMEGGKKRRHTKRKSHSKRRHTRRN
jgi:hypothetical protein